MKTPDQIVTEIDQILAIVWNSLENPQVLSEQLLKMTVLYAGIGNYLVEARDLERVCEATYKMAVERGKLHYVDEDKKSATVSESQAKIDHEQELHDFIDAQRRVDILKLKREDVERNMDAIRSRLSLIKGDMRNV